MHYPKNYVLQHHDGPGMLLDMTPEIAAEIMVPEVVPSRSNLTPPLTPPELEDAPGSSDGREVAPATA